MAASTCNIDTTPKPYISFPVRCGACGSDLSRLDVDQRRFGHQVINEIWQHPVVIECPNSNKKYRVRANIDYTVSETE